MEDNVVMSLECCGCTVCGEVYVCIQVVDDGNVVRMCEDCLETGLEMIRRHLSKGA